VGLSSEPSTLTQYAYDAASRLLTVTNGNYNATYSYLANSPLVSQLVLKSNATTRMTTFKQYDNLNRLTQISNAPSADAAVRFDYRYNSASQRVGVTNVGQSYWGYTYDALGQVTSGKKCWSDGSPVAGQEFDYGFDDIGNRKWTTAGQDVVTGHSHQANYQNNSLNQITSRDVAGVAGVSGLAASNATVTVNNRPTVRHGEYWWGEALGDNLISPLWLGVTNVGVIRGTSVNNPDIVTNVAGNVFVPKTREVFAYDADGNLTNDGHWSYAWDGENRLVRMVANSTVGPQQRLQFEYDWQGRRIRKLVWNNTAGTNTPTVDARFVYDGWNLLAIVDAQGSVVQSFVWGLDLSEAPQGAGGVGGLLGLNDASRGFHFAAYDGNGNVTAVVKGTEGTVGANYEYGPFGEVIRSTGPMANANAMQFSTKFTDAECGMLYYGYRSFNPQTGRWLSRDPLEENSRELNLYRFVRNEPLGNYDLLGRNLGIPTCGYGCIPPPGIGLPPTGPGNKNLDGMLKEGDLDKIEAQTEEMVKSHRCCCPDPKSKSGMMTITITGSVSGPKITNTLKVTKGGCVLWVVGYYWWDCATAQREAFWFDKTLYTPDDWWQQYGWRKGGLSISDGHRGSPGSTPDNLGCDNNHWNWTARVIWAYCDPQTHYMHAAHYNSPQFLYKWDSKAESWSIIDPNTKY
jgi:RHS repeat-associated protein